MPCSWLKNTLKGTSWSPIDEAFQAQIFLLERLKVLTELAASCTLAAARRLEGIFTEKDHVVLLLCGGNASLDSLMEYHRLLG